MVGSEVGGRRKAGRKSLATLAAALALTGLLYGGQIGKAQEPASPNPSNDVNFDLKTPPKGTRLDVFADRIIYDARNRIATATGKVVITYGRYELVATRVTYDMRNDKLKANGSVRLREPGGNILEADEAELQDRFREGFARHLRLLLTNDATVLADYAKRSDGYLTVFTNVSYTRCIRCADPAHPPLWELRSAEVTHDERQHAIYHKQPSLVVSGTPVLTLPYLTHPDPTVDRRTGFLVPSGRYEDAYGVGVVIPYFWAPAQDYDLTFRPIISSKQGLIPQAEWRHALWNGKYSIDGAAVYQLTEDEAPGDRRWRGYLHSEGRFALSPTTHFGWDGTIVSDDTFMDRYGFSSDDEILSRLYTEDIDDRNYFSLQAMHFRSLIPDVDQDRLPFAVPYLQHSYTFGEPVLGGELGIDSSAYYVRREENFTTIAGNDFAKSQARAVSNVHWQSQNILQGGQIITPFAGLRGDIYFTHKLPDAAEPSGYRDDEVTARLLPEAGLDMRWPFFRATDAGRHILSPVAQVIASRSEDREDLLSNEDSITVNFDHTSLFLHDRFSGFDRYEGGVRANAGLLYTFLDNDGGFLRASLGESFHIAGENSFIDNSGLAGTRSDIVGALAWQMNEHFTLNYQARLEQDLSGINVQEGGFSLAFDKISGSLNYIDVDAEPFYGREEAERQVWGNISYTFDEGWSIFGGARFDLKSSRLLEDNFGVGYEDECTRIALTYSEDYESEISDDVERSVFFQVELKTLGSAGIGTPLN
jgi:LPS-assembly protein